MASVTLDVLLQALLHSCICNSLNLRDITRLRATCKKMYRAPAFTMTKLDCIRCRNLVLLTENLMPNYLTTLVCRGCTSFVRLPARLPNRLITLDCSKCRILESLPNPLLNSLVKLYCRECDSKGLPDLGNSFYWGFITYPSLSHFR